MNLRPVLAALVLAAAPALAEGSDTAASPLARCASVTPDAARLACYDALASGAKGPAAIVGTATAVPVQPSKEQEKSWFGLDMGGLFGTTPAQQTTPAQFGEETTPKAQAQRAAAEQALDSITARTAAVSFNPLGRFTVTLDNGQVWRQIEADDGRAHFLRASSSVTISRAALGSYLLSVGDGASSYRVTRIK